MSKVPIDVLRKIFWAGLFAEAKHVEELEPMLKEHGFEIDWSEDERRREEHPEFFGRHDDEDGSTELTEPAEEHTPKGYKPVQAKEKRGKSGNMWRWPYSRGSYL